MLLALIVLATVFYTLFDIFASRAGNRIDANLSSVIFNGIGAVLPLGIYAAYRLMKQPGTVVTTSGGVLYSGLAGISIAIFSVLLIKIFEKGGLTTVIPLIYGGTVLLATLAGWLVFKEKFSMVGLLGVALIVAGIGCVVLKSRTA